MLSSSSFFVLLTVFILTIFSCSSNATNESSSSIKKEKYCIIGAGAGGMNIAWMLKQIGKDVLVLEKEKEVGGHCDTIRFRYPDGTPGWIEAGVVVHPNTTEADRLGYGPWGYSMEAIVKRFAGQDSIVSTPFGSSLPYAVDLETGQTYTLQPNFGIELQMALFTLMGIMATEYPWLDTFVNVPDPIPAELLVTFDTWLSIRNLNALYPLFNNTVFYGGYGSFNKMTALTALVQSATLTSLMYSTSPQFGWFSIRNGCKSMYEGISDYLGHENILLDVDVKRITRRRLSEGEQGKPIRINYKQGTRIEEVARCDKLVIAFPPTLENLKPLDLTRKERNLFRDVELYQLTIATADISGPISSQKFTINNVNPNRPNYQPKLPAVGIVYRYNDAGPAIINGIASIDQVRQGRLERIIESDVEMVPPSLLDHINITRYINHDYTPVWPVSDLYKSPHPFKLLDQLQGEEDTYYVGAIRSTATTAYIIKSIIVLMERIIPGFSLQI